MSALDATAEPIDYVACSRGGCHFYKRRSAPTQCRCAAMTLNTNWKEDLRVRMLNQMADVLGPERVMASPTLTTSGEKNAV